MHIYLHPSTQVFIITNDEPVFMWDFMKTLYEKLNKRPSFTYQIPFVIAFFFAYIAEAIQFVLKPIVNLKLTFTLFRMVFLSTNRYFCIDKAKRVLGYTPQVSLEKGIDLTVAWLKEIESFKH